MIAFDIDGCVNGIKEDIIRIGKSFFSEFPIVFNKNGYYLREIFQNAPEQAYETFWERYGYEIYTSPPLADVRETVDYLKINNIKAGYITSRDTRKRFNGIRFDRITSEWLKVYGISLPVYYSKDKVQTAKLLGVSLMVEDKPDNIIGLQSVTDVIIFRHPYNECINGTFAKSWREIMEMLEPFVTMNKR